MIVDVMAVYGINEIMAVGMIESKSLNLLKNGRLLYLNYTTLHYIQKTIVTSIGTL
jgi:hypothetical protein